jgi:hypothetical protein
VRGPFEGNDTGGIIPWTPETHQAQHDIADEHCGRYRKIHRITSVHARYGDYITFGCYWPRGVDPNRTIIGSAYERPRGPPALDEIVGSLRSARRTNSWRPVCRPVMRSSITAALTGNSCTCLPP